MQRIPHFFLSKRQSVDFIMQGLRTKVLREAETPDYLVFRCALCLAPYIEQSPDRRGL